MRIIGPGTVPPNVQNVYSTPSAKRLVSSRVSKLIITLAGLRRLIGGGTCGALVRTACSTGILLGSGRLRLPRENAKPIAPTAIRVEINNTCLLANILKLLVWNFSVAVQPKFKTEKPAKHDGRHGIPF